MRLVKCGSWENLYKMAMPVPITPDGRDVSLLDGGNTLVTTDPDLAEQNTLPRVKRGVKNEIKAMIGQLSLPRIMYLTEQNVITIRGKQYYFLDIKKPQKRANPSGTLILFDPEAGSIVKFPLDEYEDEIQSVRQGQAAPIIEKMKKWVPRWNRLVGQIINDNFGRVINTTTWPSFIGVVEEVVDERMQELNSMIASLRTQVGQQDPSQDYTNLLDRLEGQVREGTIESITDQIDTVAWIYFNDEARGRALLENPETPLAPEAREKLENLFRMHAGEMEAQKTQQEEDKAVREKRLQDRDPAYGAPVLEEMEMPEIQGDLPTPHKFTAPSDKERQTRAKLTGSQENLELLVPIREGLANLKSFVNGLSSRSNDFLSSDEPEADQARSSIREFNQVFKQFRRNYEGQIFRQNKEGEYSFNTALLGRTGPGNAAVGSLLNTIITVIDMMLVVTTPQPEDMGELVPEQIGAGAIMQ